MSTTIYTFNALLTKPAISFAPMIVVAILNTQGYESFRKISDRNSTGNATLDANYSTTIQTIVTSSAKNTMLEYAGLFDAMFYVSVCLPAICALLELICFAPYRLKYRHKSEIDSASDLKDN